jgi:predicted Fe-Mo cluster-binding NifX family protein
LDDAISDIFAKAPVFTFIEIEDGEIKNVEVEENTASKFAQGAGPIVMKELKNRGVDAVIAGEVGPGARTLMEFGGIKLFTVKPGTKISTAVENALEISDHSLIL